MTERGHELKVFIKEKDYWSNAEVILIVASSLEEANRMYDGMDAHEHHLYRATTLTEISTLVPAIFVLRPPGDGKMR